MRFISSAALATVALAALCLQTPAALAAETAAGDLRIVDPWARASAGHGNTGAAFMKIVNDGKEDDRLVSASTPAAGKVEVHETTMDGGVMKMRMLMGGLPVPAGGEVTLKPMGLHVMMMDVKEQLAEGETLSLTLTFEKAGSVELTVPIAGPGAMMAPNMN